MAPRRVDDVCHADVSTRLKKLATSPAPMPTCWSACAVADKPAAAAVSVMPVAGSTPWLAPEQLAMA